MRGRVALVLIVIATLSSMLPVELIGMDSPFSDVASEDAYLPSIAWLADQGITRGCNPPDNSKFCPDDLVTRGQMAAFLGRALFLRDGVGSGRYSDDDVSVFEADIERLAQAGVTRGCNPPANNLFCPDDPVTRGQMAAFLVRAFDYTDRGARNFVDDDDSVFEVDIEKLAQAGVTRGCNPPANDRFCPDEPVTREQMAAFLHRAFGSPQVGQPGLNRFDPGVVFVPSSEDVLSAEVGSGGSETVTLARVSAIPSVGKILAMLPTQDYPSGLLGWVMSVSDAPKGVVVTLQAAPLQAAMPMVAYSYEGRPTIQGHSLQASSLGEFEFECEGSPVDLKATAEVKGPDWNLVFNWGPGVPTVAHISAYALIVSGIEGSTPVGGIECEAEVEPFAFPLGTIPGPGGFPINLELEFEAELDLSLDARVGLETTRTDFFQVGAEYRNGRIQTIWDASGSTSGGDVEVTAGGSAEMFVGPLLEMSYRNLVGAEIKAGPFYQLEADILADPWWEFGRGGKGGLDIEWDLWVSEGEHTLAELTCCYETIAVADGANPDAPTSTTTTTVPQSTTTMGPGGNLERVSAGPSGSANGGSDQIRVSGDGRFAVFESEATDLVPGDSDDNWDIFLIDRLDGSVTHVSNPVHAGAIDQNSTNPWVSDDGNVVSFASGSNLVPEDTNGLWDIYIYDRNIDELSLGSVDSLGMPLDEGANPNNSLSADGRWLAFYTGDPALNPEYEELPSNQRHDALFVRDLQSSTVERVTDEPPFTLNTYTDPSISSDGRFVAWTSGATNVVAGDDNSSLDVFVSDLQAGTVEIGTLRSDGTQSEMSVNAVGDPVVADTGGLLFRHQDPSMAPGGEGGRMDWYFRDLRAGTTTRVAPEAGWDGTISADGEVAVVSSDGRLLLVSIADGLSEDVVSSVTDKSVYDVSDDGSLIAFVSSEMLDPGDSNNDQDVFVWFR